MCYVQHLIKTKYCKKSKYPNGHGINGRGNWIRQWYHVKKKILKRCPGNCGRKLDKRNPLCGCHVMTNLTRSRYIVPMCKWCNLNRNGEWIWVDHRLLVEIPNCNCGHLETPSRVHKIIRFIKMFLLLMFTLFVIILIKS